MKKITTSFYLYVRSVFIYAIKCLFVVLFTYKLIKFFLFSLVVFLNTPIDYFCFIFDNPLLYLDSPDTTPSEIEGILHASSIEFFVDLFRFLGLAFQVLGHTVSVLVNVVLLSKDISIETLISMDEFSRLIRKYNLHVLYIYNLSWFRCISFLFLLFLYYTIGRLLINYYQKLLLFLLKIYLKLLKNHGITKLVFVLLLLFY